MENDDGQEALLNNQLNEQRTLNGRLLASVTNTDRLGTNRLSSKGQAHRAGMVKGQHLYVIIAMLLFVHIYMLTQSYLVILGKSNLVM